MAAARTRSTARARSAVGSRASAGTGSSTRARSTAGTRASAHSASSYRTASSNTYRNSGASRNRTTHKKRKKQAGRVRRHRTAVSMILLVLITVVVTILTTIAIFRLTEQSVHADTTDEMTLCYTSVEIEPGDTLWSIAEESDLTGFSGKKEFIDAIERINNISGDNIHAGNALILPYYS